MQDDSMIHSAIPLSVYCLAAATFGLASHLTYWIHGHRVRHATWTFLCHLAALFILGWKLTKAQGNLNSGLFATAAIFLSYLGSLFTSIAVYRVFFHRLANFPGPFAAKITKLYGLYAARNAQVNDHHTSLMRQYGDFVRIAPNELMVMAPEALFKVQGMTSKCSKKNTGIFDILHSQGDRMIVALLGKEEHIARRKIWNLALDTKMLPQYQPKIRKEVMLWLDTLSKIDGPIDITHYMTLLSFDLTGAVGYSADYQTIKTGKENRTLHLLEASFKPFGKLGFLAWPVQIALELGFAKEQKEFEELSIKTVDKRVADDSEDKVDILKYFLQDYKTKQTSFNSMNSIYTESQAILIGATDSTSGTMAWILCYLIKHPKVQAQLLEELEPAFGKTTPGEFSDTDLRGLPFLQAVIDETLRLQPPAGNGSARMTPPEGIEIAGTHIPGQAIALTKDTVSWPYYVRDKEGLAEAIFALRAPVVMASPKVLNRRARPQSTPQGQTESEHVFFDTRTVNALKPAGRGRYSNFPALAIKTLHWFEEVFAAKFESLQAPEDAAFRKIVFEFNDVINGWFFNRTLPKKERSRFPSRSPTSSSERRSILIIRTGTASSAFKGKGTSINKSVIWAERTATSPAAALTRILTPVTRLYPIRTIPGNAFDSSAAFSQSGRDRSQTPKRLTK
ncbi:hypothetical protein PspLS_12176 [Pyricularia sp. CBS 133598]|nr:hypothetical protein PspLS_12176 [Pyricularia sp. CBS 133598]